MVLGNGGSDQVDGLTDHLRRVHREEVGEDDEQDTQEQVPGVLCEIRIQLEQRSHASGEELSTFGRLPMAMVPKVGGCKKGTGTR